MSIISAQTISGNYIWPTAPPAGSIGSLCSGGSYTYYMDDDRYSAAIPLAVGSNAGTNVPVGAKALGTNQAGLAGSIARVFDIGCMWRNIETSAGVYNWAILDAFISAKYAAGQDILFTVFGTPAFYTSSVDASSSYGTGALAFPDLNSAALGTFVTALVNRYIARDTPIKFIEVWNEPKYVSGTSSYFIGTPTQLAQIAKIVSQSAKAIDSTIKILSPSPTGLENVWVLNDGSGTDNLHKFLSASDGAAGFGKTWIDYIAIHSYSHSGYNNLFSAVQMVANVKAVLTANSMSTSTPIWVTETSAISPAMNTLTVQDQKNYLARSLILLLAAGVSRVVWYGFGPLGFADASVQAHWNYLVGLLQGATITANYALLGGGPGALAGQSDWLTAGNGNTYGKVWATINGTRYAF